MRAGSWRRRGTGCLYILCLYILSVGESHACRQLAAQGDRLSNEEMLQMLMESRACGHAFMDPVQATKTH